MVQFPDGANNILSYADDYESQFITATKGKVNTWKVTFVRPWLLMLYITNNLKSNMGNNAVTWSEHVLSTNKKGREKKFFVTILFIKCSNASTQSFNNSFDIGGHRCVILNSGSSHLECCCTMLTFFFIVESEWKRKKFSRIL